MERKLIEPTNIIQILSWTGANEISSEKLVILECGWVHLECLIPRRSDERGGFLHCLEHEVGVP